MGSLRSGDAMESMSLWFPHEDVILAFRKLYPAEWFQAFQWPMLASRASWTGARVTGWSGMDLWDRPPRPTLVRGGSVWRRASSTEPTTARPGYGLDPDAHFSSSLQWTIAATLLEVLPTLDDDLWYAASMVMDNHNLKERRRASIAAIKELKRRWAPVSKHLRSYLEA